MDQTGQYIFEFLRHYGYLIMLPLMIIEGPIVTIIAAMLASLGAFNVFLVLGFSILGDMIGDVALYYLGYYFGMGFVRRVGRHIGITEKLVRKMGGYFKKYGGRTVFVVKSTTGLCWATFVAAGIAKMNFRKFLKNSFYGGIVWSGFLVIMGYFYGYLWREIRDNISWIGWIMVGLALVSFFGLTMYKKYKAKKIFNGSKD